MVSGRNASSKINKPFKQINTRTDTQFRWRINVTIFQCLITCDKTDLQIGNLIEWQLSNNSSQGEDWCMVAENCQSKKLGF